MLRPPVSDIVHALKYEGWAELAPSMAQALAREFIPGEALITYVPTSRERVRQRGYNQAELLARAYAGRIGRPITGTLVRRAGGTSQTTLHPSDRMANVAGAFEVAGRAAEAVRHRPVVLVDDVLTTGATASAAASVLAAAGALDVTLLTYARALPYAARNAA